MHRISAEPAKAHVCYQLSPPNTKSHANAHFIAFDIDKHAVLGNFVIHLAFYRKKKDKNKQVLLAYFYGVSLSIMTTSYSSNSYANFHAKSDLLLVLIFIKSSIDVHQISQKKGRETL